MEDTLNKAIGKIVDDFKQALKLAAKLTDRVSAYENADTPGKRLIAILPAQIKEWQQGFGPVIPPDLKMIEAFIQYGFITKDEDGDPAWSEMADEVFTAMGFEKVGPPATDA